MAIDLHLTRNESGFHTDSEISNTQYPDANHSPSAGPSLNSHHPSAQSEAAIFTDSGEETNLDHAVKPIQFQTHYIDALEMFGDASTLAHYFDAHEGWFRNCAHPMQADLITATGYAITIGRFGAFGYQIEPKIGLDMEIIEPGFYKICSIPVPGYTPPGYEVDFQSFMRLREDPDGPIAIQTRRGEDWQYLPRTWVEWNLNLQVTIQFPRFIYRLSRSVIQSTGDQLLHQIVRQVSHRLNQKVQEDFHQRYDLPLPRQVRRKSN